MQLFCTCTGLTRKCKKNRSTISNGNIRKKIVLYKALFFYIKTEEIPLFFVLFFASGEKKPSNRVLSNYLGMKRTVLLNCPIETEIRAVDSQSNLTILL